jgi:hypothetical protein
VLKSGIRLSAPYCCPTSIGVLIQQCFEEDPAKRPTFSNIKMAVKLAHAGLSRAAPTSINNELRLSSSESQSVEYADIQMRDRYLKMRIAKGNNSSETEKHLSEDSSCQLNPSTLSVSFKSKALKYVSLEDLISERNMVNQNLDQNSQYLMQQASTLNKANTQSPEKSNLKRCFSDSEEDSTELVRPLLKVNAANPYHTLPKSYANPSYLLHSSSQNLLT